MDGLEYYVSLIPNHGLEISINVEFKIASDKLPFMRLKEIIEKDYNVPGNPASNGDLDLEEIGWAHAYIITIDNIVRTRPAVSLSLRFGLRFATKYLTKCWVKMFVLFNHLLITWKKQCKNFGALLHANIA